jgi:hypothetical protein
MFPTLPSPMPPFIPQANAPLPEALHDGSLPLTKPAVQSGLGLNPSSASYSAVSRISDLTCKRQTPHMTKKDNS